MSYLMIVWLCVTPSAQAYGVGPGSEDPVHPLSRRDAERLNNEAGDLTAELSSWHITEAAILVGVVVGSFVLITLTIFLLKKCDESRDLRGATGTIARRQQRRTSIASGHIPLEERPDPLSDHPPQTDERAPPTSAETQA